MGRGIVVTGNCFIDETTIDLSGGISDLNMRRYLTYFDKIVYADSTNFGGSDSGGLIEYTRQTKKYKCLIDANILYERLLKTPFEGAPFLSKEMQLSRPIAQLEVLRELRSTERENLWALAQTGNILVLPQERKVIDTFELSFKNSLPVPINCNFERILELKEAKRDYFIEFQHTLDGFTERVSKAENTNDEFIKAKEEIEKNLIAINRSLEESKIERIYSTLQASVNLSVDNLTSLLPIVVGYGTFGGVGALAGLGANAFLNYRLTKNIKLDNLDPNLKPYLYLYEVEKLNR